MKALPPLSVLALAIASPLTAVALEIEGVQIASMDQPRVTVMVQRPGEAQPLSAKGDPAMAELLGMGKEASERVAGLAAFLDTGASGVSISTQTADSLGIKRLNAGDKPIAFYDIGVGGADEFGVSEPLLLSIGTYQSFGLSADSGSFRPAGGPWNAQIGPLSGGGLLGMLMGGIDIAGMPVMAGKIVVIDARPVNTFSDTLRVQLIDPRQETPRLPETHRHIFMSYGDFGPFTTVEPKNATRPVTTANPFIGRAPTLAENITRDRDITIRHNGKSSRGAWLLDTGAAASMISKRQAAALGIRYKTEDGTELEGVPKDKQFTLTTGGVGGQKTAAGFILEEMRIPTAEGDDLVYHPAPVLVADITVEHPETGQTVTLDGIFGMNFLVASAQITGGLAPDLGKMVEGPYDFIVIDHTKGSLGLSLRKELRK